MQFLLLVFVSFLSISPIDGRILGAFVLPHGGIALNPSQFVSTSKWAKQWAWTIHRSAVEVGRHIRNLEPELIFLSSPHAVADLNTFQFYLNGRANGTAESDNCKCPPCCYNLAVRIDSELSLELAEKLALQGRNVSGTVFFGPPRSLSQPSILRVKNFHLQIFANKKRYVFYGNDRADSFRWSCKYKCPYNSTAVSCPFLNTNGGCSNDRWGEVIPLIFVRDLHRTKLVIMSQPIRRYNRSVEMIDELLDLGEKKNVCKKMTT